MTAEGEMSDEHERIVDFLCGSGPDAKGLWFDEVAAREKGRPFWWRRYVRQAERAHAARIKELEAERDAIKRDFDTTWAVDIPFHQERRFAAETALAAEREKVARLREWLTHERNLCEAAGDRAGRTAYQRVLDRLALASVQTGEKP